MAAEVDLVQRDLDEGEGGETDVRHVLCPACEARPLR